MDYYSASSLNNSSREGVSRHSNATSWSRAIHIPGLELYILCFYSLLLYIDRGSHDVPHSIRARSALHHRYTQHQQKLSKLNMNKHSIKHIINISIRKVLWYKRGNQKRLFEKWQAIAKRKRTKRQTIIYITPHRKLKIEQHEHHYKSAANSSAREE